MTREELLEKHKEYHKRVADWQFYSLAYDGGKAFIKHAIGDRNPRESRANHKQRIADAVNFNYCEAIVNLFNFYLTEKPAIRDLKSAGLDKNLQWQMFQKDSDLNGTDFDEFMNGAQKDASIFGAIGLLVDKPRSKAKTVEQEIEMGVYPYVVPYTPPDIFDWRYERDPVSGKPVLSYLKLRGANDEIYIWTLARWEVWKDAGDKKDPQLVETDENKLSEIPFTWLQNIKRITVPLFGRSDLVDIGQIVASIVRNYSSGEEIIKFAGFPMLRKAMEEEGKETTDEVGLEAVQQFNPEFGDRGKTDWLESAALEPIEAILKWTDRKVDEIYRIVHMSGVHGQRKSNNEVSSGIAIRTEFQQLFSVLSKKADNLSETERRVVYFWMKWQGLQDKYNDGEVDIRRQKEFSLDELSIDLDNALKSMTAVVSPMFRIRKQQQIAKQSLPDMSDADKKTINDEIEAAKGDISGIEKPKAHNQVKGAVAAN